MWTTIDELWLSADHYKWRAMRLAGVPEERITGDVDPWDRFSAWAATMPRLVRNPLYVWTHLELRRVFGINTVLDGQREGGLGRGEPAAAEPVPRQMLAMFRVELVATTDDPSDGLEAHRRLATEATDVRMVPTFRPDRAHALLTDPATWNAWADRLADTEGARSPISSRCSPASRRHTRFAARAGVERQTTASHACPIVLAIPRSPTRSCASRATG